MTAGGGCWGLRECCRAVWGPCRVVGSLQGPWVSPKVFGCWPSPWVVHGFQGWWGPWGPSQGVWVLAGFGGVPKTPPHTHPLPATRTCVGQPPATHWAWPMWAPSVTPSGAAPSWRTTGCSRHSRPHTSWVSSRSPRGGGAFPPVIPARADTTIPRHRPHLQHAA